eukprot:7080567-Pyramimonas_sp.AAC.1
MQYFALQVGGAALAGGQIPPNDRHEARTLLVRRATVPGLTILCGHRRSAPTAGGCQRAGPLHVRSSELGSWELT